MTIGPFTPSDTLVGPIVHQLATYINTEITGINKVYEQDPDGSPLDNTVTIPLVKFEVKECTFGKMEVTLKFSVIHWFRRGVLGTGITKCYSFLMPYLQVLTAWSQNDINNLARQITVTDGGVTQISYSSEPHVGLVINIDVCTEYNEITS